MHMKFHKLACKKTWRCTFPFNTFRHILGNVKNQRLIAIVAVGDTANHLVRTVLVSKRCRGRGQTAKTDVMCDRVANEAAYRMAPGPLTGVERGLIDSIEMTVDSSSFQNERRLFEWLACGDTGNIWQLHTGHQNHCRKDREVGQEALKLHLIDALTKTTTAAAATWRSKRDPERPRTDSCDVVASSRAFDGDVYSVPRGNTCLKMCLFSGEGNKKIKK